MDQLEPDLVLELLQRQVPQAGVLEPTDASSARARSRGRTFRSASRPPRVLVANTVIRQPLESVMRNWAPGWGVPGGR